MTTQTQKEKDYSNAIEVKNYINGKWVPSVTGRTFERENPANINEIVSIVPLSNQEDILKAIEAAKNAKKMWQGTPAPKRAEIIYKAGQILLERKEELARLMTREMGKVIEEARGDVQEAIDMAFYMGGEGRRLFGYYVPSELKNKWCIAVRDPIGVVAAITPWNFPIAIPAWKIFPALVAGNTVVFKPSEHTAACAAEFVKALEEAGLPEGVLNMVVATGKDCGTLLFEHPDIDMISFTGSLAVGKLACEVAGRHMKKVMTELGGKNAIIVMDDANLDLAVDGITWSAFGTTGQRCTACSRIIVHEKVYDEVIERVAEKIKQLRIGNGLDPNTQVGPLAFEAQLRKVEHYVEIGKNEGRLVIGGERYTEGECANGYFYSPTLFADVEPNATIAQEEIFGPVLSAIKVKSLDEAIEVNNSVQYGLSAGIFTQDINKALYAVQWIRTGICYVNGQGTIGAEIQLPFGGVRGTGNGHREAGIAGIESYSEWKSIYIDFSGRLQRSQIDA